MRRSVWLSLTAFAATAVPVGWGLPHRFHVEGMPYVAGILPAGLEGVPGVAGILPAGVEGVSPSNRGQGAANAFSRVGDPPEALGTRGRDARDTVVGQAPPYRSAFASQDPNRVVRIVVLQAGRAHSKQGNPGSEANFHLLAGLAREAAKSQPDLIVFPEYAISGWPYPREEIINGLAETIPGDGPWYLRYQALARETRTALLGWLVEKEGDKLYNCSFLVDPNGAFVGKYRKVQANLGEQTWWGWSQGESFQPIEYRGVKYGISICADMWFPETVRCEELLGAHVIVHVSIADDMMHIIPTRAFDSEIPIVLAIFNGGSYAVDPQGKLLDK
ncbi:MAG: carbon-nitrogen hydrolase family protein, partial [Planctomycetes bacterium]|nr:carbon-nitrogen hydrolase family protein [Planctomycetota bacterium]